MCSSGFNSNKLNSSRQSNSKKRKKDPYYSEHGNWDRPSWSSSSGRIKSKGRSKNSGEYVDIPAPSAWNYQIQDPERPKKSKSKKSKTTQDGGSVQPHQKQFKGLSKKFLSTLKQFGKNTSNSKRSSQTWKSKKKGDSKHRESQEKPLYNFPPTKTREEDILDSAMSSKYWGR